MDEADRLGPWPPGCGAVAFSQLSRTFAREGRRERMVGRPPDFRGQAVAAVAKRLDYRREQQCLADGHNLRIEPLLRRLGPEVGEVGRNHVAGDDLAAGFLESGNLRGEIIGERLIASRVDKSEAFRLQCRRDGSEAPGLSHRWQSASARQIARRSGRSPPPPALEFEFPSGLRAADWYHHVLNHSTLA